MMEEKHARVIRTRTEDAKVELGFYCTRIIGRRERQNLRHKLDMGIFEEEEEITFEREL